jgi:hypothetical protein
VRQRIHLPGLPERKILKLLVRVLPSLLPDSVESSSFKLLVFSPIKFSFSGTQVALGQSGIMALAKALIGFDIEFVIFDYVKIFLLFMGVMSITY